MNEGASGLKVMSLDHFVLLAVEGHDQEKRLICPCRR